LFFVVTKAASGNPALAAFHLITHDKVGASSAVESPKLNLPGAAPGHLAIFNFNWGRMFLSGETVLQADCGGCDARSLHQFARQIAAPQLSQRRRAELPRFQKTEEGRAKANR